MTISTANCVAELLSKRYPDFRYEDGSEVDLFDDLGMDSLEFVGLVFDIEQMLGTEIDLSMRDPDSFSRVGGLVAAIEEERALKNA